MTTKLKFEHRQPPDGWMESASTIEGCLRIPVESARFIVQELAETAANMSIQDAPNENEVEGLIHKATIVMDHLGDISEMLDEMEISR